MPVFSVIIPVFNMAPWLHECLGSLLAQSFQDWEALCVDDGSTDGSGDILDEYAAKDARFRVFHQANAGVSAARNAALDRAKGEWICFLDSDDKVEGHWLQDIATGAGVHPEADWIRTSYRDWFEGQEPQPWPDGSPYKLSEAVRVGPIDVMAWEALSTNAMLVLNILRRSLVRHTRFQTDLRHCEDGCFILDCLLASRSRFLLTIPNDDYRYRIRHSSASHSMSCGDVLSALYSLMERWSRNRGKWGVFSPAIDRFLSRWYHSAHHVTHQEGDRVQEFLWRALATGFFSPFHLRGKKKKVKWIAFMFSGRPQLVFGTNP